MGAPNFALRNANRYFIIEEPEDADFWFWSDAKEELARIAVESHGFEWLENDEWRKKLDRSDRLNSYPAEALPIFFEAEYKDKFGLTWRATLVPMIRSGYYAHACLDYYIELTNDYGDKIDNEDVDNTSVVGSMISDYVEWCADHGDIFSEDDLVTLGVEVSRLIKQLKDKFYEWAEDCNIDEYAKAWQGSNGEAGYTNLSEIKRKARKEAV